MHDATNFTEIFHQRVNDTYPNLVNDQLGDNEDYISEDNIYQFERNDLDISIDDYEDFKK